MKTIDLSHLMRTAWQFFRTTGKSFSECLKMAWKNIKIVAAMQRGIIKFHFQKVDGSIREAWGTLKKNIIPATTGTDNRRRNEFTQVYFDTEKQEWRCFKKLNLIY
jgi:hypothetical protein